MRKLTVHLLGIFVIQIGFFSHPKRKPPRDYISHGAVKLWRRPTLACPIDALPSAMSRFTSGFDMGPGGTTTLRPPDYCPPRGKSPPGKGRLSAFVTFVFKEPRGDSLITAQNRFNFGRDAGNKISDSLRIKKTQ